MDKKIFTEKVLEAEDTLYHISKTILKRDSDCEDAVQEAILKAYASLPKLKKEEYFKTWLVRILINESYKILKKQKNHVSYEEYMEEEAAKTADFRPEIKEAVMNLPEKKRMVVVLYYIEGYGINEIADILKIPEGTVKSRLAAARKELKMDLERKEVTLYG